MAKSVVIVHNDPDFTDAITANLALYGCSTVVYSDPNVALDALDDPQTKADLLITRTAFQAGKVNGIALARMMRLKRPDMKLLVTGKPEFAEFADGVAEFLPQPINLDALLATATQLLEEQNADSREWEDRP